MNSRRGFTIVELLIVIVVIAVLAAISVVAFRGIQERARDTQRAQDVKTIAKALELYYADNGRFPNSYCGSNCPTPKKINSSWATTSDGSWNVLESQLVPKYISKLPRDPRASESTNSAIEGGQNYDYVRFGGRCASTTDRAMITYRFESKDQRTEITGGECSDPFLYGPSSEFIILK